MNFKKNVVVFTIMICIFFSISGAVASDVNDTDIATYENQEIGDVNDEVVAYSQEDLISDSDDDLIGNSQEDLISKSKTGTFTELQILILNASNGDTIILDKDYSYDVEYKSAEGVLISKNITIDGNGHTLNGLSKSRILMLLPGMTNNNKVTLKNIVFKNGFTKLYGGAIFNFADLTVNNCVFKNNYANTTAGAIASVGSLNCKNSKFYKNTANGDAGAIFSLNVEGSFKLFNNYLQNSDSIDFSQIILAMMMKVDLKPSTDYISKCKFSNNVALGRGGGAVYAYTHIKIYSSTFTSNKANEIGGAVYGAKNLYIKSSKFTKNSAYQYGGAVYFKYHEISGYYDADGNWKNAVKFYSNSIKKCTFTKNSAKERGGAIYGFKYSGTPKVLPAKAIKCTFRDNSASEGNEIYGGTLKNCAFKNTLTIKTVKVKKSAGKLVLTAIFKQGSKIYKNKMITFTFKDVTYKAKTNSKGIAKVTVYSNVLNKLKVGKKVKYQASYGKFTDRKMAKVLK